MLELLLIISQVFFARMKKKGTRSCTLDNMNVLCLHAFVRKLIFQPISSRNTFRLKARDQVSVRIARIVRTDFIDQTEMFISMSASSCCANIGIRSYFSHGEQAIKISEDSRKQLRSSQHVCIEYCQQICDKSEQTDNRNRILHKASILRKDFSLSIPQLFKLFLFSASLPTS